MDTKLKNSRDRHWLGILLLILLTAVMAAATVSSYPYMRQKAIEQKSADQTQRENENSEFERLDTQIMNFSYVIWHQQKQEENGRILSFSQTFYPGLDEKLRLAQENEGADTAEWSDSEEETETLRQIQGQITDLGRRWQEMYEKYNGTLIRYAVMGENGEYLRSNVTDPQSVFAGEPSGDQIRFTAEFSTGGRLAVTGLSGAEDACSRLYQAMNSYEFYDPVASRLGSQYRTSGAEFKGPENIKIQFLCELSVLGRGTSDAAGMAEDSVMLNSWDYQGGGYFMVLWSITAIVTVIALVLPGIRSLQIGRSALCRLSFEPLSMLGCLWFATVISSIPADLIRATMDGRITDEWMKAGFAKGAADMLTLLLNLLFWMVIYGVLCWGITCIRAVFTLGLWRYFKERTWLGRFLRWCKQWVCKGLDLFSNTDWESRSTRIIGKAVIANFIILALISCLWFWGIGALVIYSLVLFILLKKYWGQMQERYQLLLKGIHDMAEGDLDVEFAEDLGVFEPFKEQISHIRDGFKKAVAQEVKSEKTKSELITNVSHDLKTPLTAIITYINLLKQENITKEERDSYIEVLDRKSMRLKELIEDLFEISKANSGTVTLHLDSVDIVSLIKQVRYELADKIEASGVDFRFTLPDEKLTLRLDCQKTCRIFENLMVNITKYAMRGTRAYIQARREEGGYVAVTMRNISENELKVSPQELTDRFVRGDQSRNTEGSGLGLAIARSFTEAQGGTMELELEEDIFKVTVRWREETQESPLVSEAAAPLSETSHPPVPEKFAWWDPEENEILEENAENETARPEDETKDS